MNTLIKATMLTVMLLTTGIHYTAQVTTRPIAVRLPNGQIIRFYPLDSTGQTTACSQQYPFNLRSQYATTAENSPIQHSGMSPELFSPESIRETASFPGNSPQQALFASYSFGNKPTTCESESDDDEIATLPPYFQQALRNILTTEALLRAQLELDEDVEYPVSPFRKKVFIRKVVKSQTHNPSFLTTTLSELPRQTDDIPEERGLFFSVRKQTR